MRTVRPRVGLALLVFAICPVIPSLGLSQIPNQGFESWSGGEPLGWSTTNKWHQPTSVTATPESHSGSFAARGDAPFMSGSYGYAYIIAEFPCSEIPERMKLHYKFIPRGEDALYVEVSFRDIQGYIGVREFADGFAVVTDPAYDYALLDIPLNRIEAGLPAHCWISIGIESQWGMGMGDEPKGPSTFMV